MHPSRNIHNKIPITGTGIPATAEGVPPHADHDLFDPGHAHDQSDYIVVYDCDGKILYVNPAMERATGYAADQMIGTPFLHHVAEEFRDMAAARMAARQETGEVPLYELAIHSAGGDRRSVIVKCRPIRYGTSPATLLFLIDITQRKVLEDELLARAEELSRISNAYRQANRKLTLLSTITRHDINNQLTVLKGYLEILATAQPDPKLTEFCTRAETAAERIAAMIRFTREYEEIGISEPAWKDCRMVADAAIAEAPLGQVAVKNDLPVGREVFADPLIVKVFYNLMDNAVRYGGKITTIEFTASERNGTLLIICADDGQGVPADEKERIFERGFGKNTGLGLALSREILDITGITIMENGEPGKGARFEIAVPPVAWRDG
ncbi:MAG: PAS domain-containing sensor histidine kinase [Methanoregula sp.]|jgi:PAS domain S-box-containing protein|nr:PAS domain-containing sensor histidine kinase [Methanoregula sp.]